jgi:ABC-2 type transport system permease protein
MGAVDELEKIWYFMKRDMISFSTYKTNIAILVFSAVFGALSYAYLGQSSVNQLVIQEFHTDFTTYLIIGLAFNTYLGQALTLVQKTINPWALEEVLVSPTSLTTFIIGSSIWGFVWSTAVVAVYLLIGVYFFGITLAVNVVGTLIVLALGIGTFIGFSMIGSGVLILTKQGDPVAALIPLATSLFGNVLFPPQVLPAFLQIIAYVTPPYYFFTSIKLILTGATLASILPDIEILAVMCAIIVPLGYAAYAWCLKTSRKNGTLSWF